MLIIMLKLFFIIPFFSIQQRRNVPPVITWRLSFTACCSCRVLLEVGHAHETSTAKCYASAAAKSVNNPEIKQICTANNFSNRVPAELVAPQEEQLDTGKRERLRKLSVRFVLQRRPEFDSGRQEPSAQAWR